MTLWIVLPLIGALIGWWTNRVALWMLFRPRRAVRLLFWNWQGVIPGRREALAESLSRALNEHLLTPQDTRHLLSAIPLEEHLDRIVTQTLDRQIPRDLFSRKFPRLPAMDNVREKLIDVLRREILKRLPKNLSELDDATLTRIADDIHVADHIRERLIEIPLEDFEKLVWQVARRELRSIELAGALIGFIIGFAQAAVLVILHRVGY